MEVTEIVKLVTFNWEYITVFLPIGLLIITIGIVTKDLVRQLMEGK